MRRLILLIATTVLAVQGVAWAQPSLAEVARKEADRRKTVKESGKTYTNADVKGGTPLTTAAAPPEKPAEAPGTAPAAAGGVEGDQSTSEPATEVHDQAWWGKRMTDLRDELNRNRLFSDALQSRINALWADFTARDDPAQRAVIEKDRNEAITELDRVKKDIERGTRAIADLEEEARKMGVPPGWLR